MRAIVTAGGTREPIDDVRAITNTSRGLFGCALARALLDRGVAVTLVASRDLAERPGWIPDGADVVEYGSYAELVHAMVHAIGDVAPDFVLMAAAVADYSPIPAEGKLRSDGDELVLRLTRNPKLLSTLRDRCPDAVLVGFKLLSGVSPDELAAVGVAQCQRDRLDLTVANDLRDLEGDRHPVTACAADGTTTRIDDQRNGTARAVVDLALARRRVDPAVADLASMTVASGLSLVDRGDALRQRMPWVATLLHLPGVLAVPDATIDVPFTWGCVEEAGRIESALAGARRWHRRGAPAFTVGSADGAAIVGLETGGLARIAREWQLALAEHQEFDPRPEIRRKPVFEGGRVVGVAAEHATARGMVRSIHLRRSVRGRGVGDQLAVELDRMGEPVLGPAAWWVQRGWLVTGPGEPLSRLEPPSRRQDLVPAASVCLFDPLRRRVLLGRRRTGIAAGMWAFPGGKREPGEVPFATAARELMEETGLPMPPVAATWSCPVHAGDGKRAYEVQCFGVTDLSCRDPQPTVELEAAWVPYDDAPGLRPMTPGTRRILRKLLDPA